MNSRKIYYGCGVAFESELELRGIPVACGQRPTATVRIGEIPAERRVDLTGQNWFHATPQCLQFSVPNIGRYLITNGREILIEPVSGASDIDLRVFLMGSAFGGLLHQRGVLPLHASSVCVGDSYVAFVGNSGDGKSTQAAVLHYSGYSLAGDDICPVSVSPDGTAVADYGFPRLKLWSDALKALNIDSEGLERSSVDRDKYDVSTRDRARSESLPLRAVYVLEYVDDEHSVGIEPILGRDCLPQLLRHTYRYLFVDGLGSTQQHFHSCMQLAASVPIFRLRRQRGFQVFPMTVKMLEQHWAQSGLVGTGFDDMSAAA